jgi:hypothetical protein
VTIAAGLIHAVTAGAYLFLFVIAVREVRRAERVVAFDAALTLMFLGCGSHHAVHAEHALIFGRPADATSVVALAIAAVPSAIFLALRVEAMRGGRGDRFIPGTPAWLGALPVLLGAAAGALLLGALMGGPASVPDLPGLASNLVLLATYSMVGWFLIRTQVARRPLRGGWSLSGVSLATIFPACAVAHVVSALVSPGDVHTLVVDGYQIPVSLFFLWTVHSLYRRGRRLARRRPVVGRSRSTPRPSPWATSAG